MDGDKIKKKLLIYARDYALDKINKTLDKKMANDNESPHSDSANGGEQSAPFRSSSGGRPHVASCSRDRMTTSRSSHRHHHQYQQEPSAPDCRRSTKDDEVVVLRHLRRPRVRLTRDQRDRYSRVRTSDGDSCLEGDEGDEDEVSTSRSTTARPRNSQVNHLVLRNSQQSSPSHSLRRGARGERGIGGGSAQITYASHSVTSHQATNSRKKSLPNPPQFYAPLPRRRSYMPTIAPSPPSRHNSYKASAGTAPDLVQTTTADRRRPQSGRTRLSMFSEDDDDAFLTADGESTNSDATSTDSEHDDDDDDYETDGISGTAARNYIANGSSVQNRSNGINKYVVVDIEHEKPAQTSKIPRLERTQRTRNQALALNFSEHSPNKSTTTDGRTNPSTPSGHSHHAHPNATATSDYSGYIQKKSLAQGMMDLALLSANINQMRYLLEYKDNQPYFATSFTLVVTSLFLQIAVSLTLIWNIRFNVKKRNEMEEADRVNNIGVIGIFLVTIINVALSTFGGAPAPKEILVSSGGHTTGFDGIGGTTLEGSGDGLFTHEPTVYT